MRKILLFILIFVLICFLIPIIFTKKYTVAKVDVVTNIEDKNSEEETVDYKEYSTIKLLHTNTLEVEEIALDEYLYGVVSAEMPASYELEALKAQAVVARTYTVYKTKNGSKHENADICDDSNCCQAWISKEDRFSKWNEEEQDLNWEKIVTAVNNTKGEIITYEGEPINAFFHSNSGGVTETAENVWGGTNYPYLQIVETAGEDAYNQYSSEVILTKDELVEKIRFYHSDIKIDFTKEDEIKILEYTDSGRVKTIKFGNIEISGTETRQILRLKSTMFTIETNDKNIIFKVTGYGHGVGLSQTGADSMAKMGSNYEDIIKHYYIGVEVQKNFSF